MTHDPKADPRQLLHLATRGAVVAFADGPAQPIAAEWRKAVTRNDGLAVRLGENEP